MSDNKLTIVNIGLPILRITYLHSGLIFFVKYRSPGCKLRAFCWHNFYADINRGDRIMEGWDIKQQCELAPLTGVYDKEQFIKAISSLSPEDFNRLCRTFLHLSLFHAQHQGAWVTDDTELIERHPQLFWKIQPINPDAPIDFRRVK